MAASRVQSAVERTASTWLASAGPVLKTAGAGALVGEVLSIYRTGHLLDLAGLLFFAALGWAALSVAAFGRWCVRRRILLKKESLPDPGPVEMWKAWRLELKHIRYLKQQWPSFCHANKILGWGKVVPPLRKITATVDGDLGAMVHPGPLHVPKGVDALRAAKDGARQSFGLYHCEVTEVGIGHAWVQFLWTDEFERNLPIQRLPVAPKGRIAYGLHRNGTVASLDPNKSTLVAGVQGSGKSSLAWTIIAHWLRTGEWVDLYVIDPKGGQEWGWLLRMATIDDCHVRVKGFAKDEAGALKLLNEALERVKKRQLVNGEIDLEDWTQNPVRQVIPTKDEPRIVILADELLHLRKALKDSATSPSPFGQFISIGRSAAASVIAVTQDATKETVGMVRGLFGQRIALRTESPSMTNMVLADGAESSGATCSSIPESKPGLGYAYDKDHHGFAEVRVAHVTDADIRNDIQYGRAPAGMLGEAGVEQPCFNYRIYTSDMQPLRTGITNKFEDRYKQYRSDYERERLAIESGHLDPAKALHQWFAYHDPATIKVEEAPSRAVALARESEYIAQGVWRGNHQQNMHSVLRNVPPPEVENKPQRRPSRHRQQSVPVQSVQQAQVVPITRERRRPTRTETPTPRTRRRSA